MDIDRFIYEFNLVSTLTVKDNYEWAYVLNNRLKKEIDYSNSINLYQFIDLFNKLYLKFKMDYDMLDRLNLGKRAKILRFYKWEENNIKYRRAVIYLDNLNKEICNDYDTFLYLYEKDNEVFSYVTNDLLPWEKGYYKVFLDLDRQLIRNYLNLFDKYSLLIDSYNYLKNKFIFGNGTTVLFSKINGELLDNISTFEVSFGNAYFNSSDYINIVFKLGDILDYNYGDCKVILDLKDIYNNKEILDKLIEKIYINRDKLSNMYRKKRDKKI